MGKIFTFINKDCVNKKVRTSALQEWLDDGWSIGNWNQDELNKRSGAGVKATFEKMRGSDAWEERNKHVSEGLHRFWLEDATQEYIDQREVKKAASREAWTDEEKELYHNRMSESAKKDRASTSKEEYARRKKKEIETKKKNGTMTSSNPEKESYDILVNIFPDVVRWYNEDPRYPYECDLYIPSKDLFIECNYHYTHGPHPFNCYDKDDLALLEDIRSKQGYLDNGNKNSYYIYEDVWTKRDVEKMTCAKANNLNYIYAYTLDEFISKIEEIIDETK